MFLSRLFLNPLSRQVQREIADRYQLHRTIMAAFPETLPADERVLFRLEEHQQGSIVLLVQSKTPPNWEHVSARHKDYLLTQEGLPIHANNPAVKEIDLAFRSGQRLTFRLLANPTAKKSFQTQENRSGGKKRIGLYDLEEQEKWLERKFQQAGCRAISVQVRHPDTLKTSLQRDEQRHQLTLAAVQFDGVLVVEDPDLFLNALEQGIGSAKGLGFGLLSLGPEGAEMT